MAKKPAKASKVPVIQTYHKRGTKRISLQLPQGKKAVNNIEASLIDFNWNKIDYLRTKNKFQGNDGKKHYIPPRGFTVIVQVVKKGKTYHYTRISPVDMAATKRNIQEFTAKTIQDLENDWSAAKEAMDSGEPDDDDGPPAEYMENVDPKFIKEITIHFLY